jgi:hypothetical protein
MTSFQSDQWIKPTNNRRRLTKDGSSKDSKLAKPSDHWLNPTTTSNRFTALQQDLHNHPPRGKEATPNPPIYIASAINTPPLPKLLDQIVPQLYEIKELEHNQDKIKPKNPDSYRIITKALLDRHTQSHTFKPKEERPYRVVLKDMHYLIDPEDIKTEIANLGHKVANIWNIKHYRAKQPLSMFFIDLLPAPNNKGIFNVEFLQQCKNGVRTAQALTRYRAMCQLSAIWAH